MRITTNYIQTQFLAAIGQLQANLAQTQNQVALGQRFTSPSQDPVAAGNVNSYNLALAQSQQFDRNANIAQNRLGLEDNALSQFTTDLQRIRDLALACAAAALEKKAVDVSILDVQGLTSLADYFVVCSGRSDTQVRAIAEGIEAACRATRRRPLAVEGAALGKWILIDLGDVLVHVFQQPIREFYDLEKLWSRARSVELPEPRHDPRSATSDPELRSES